MDVNSIERNLYQSICEEFSVIAENRMLRYQTVLPFLRYIKINTILNQPTRDIYKLYSDYCTDIGVKPMAIHVFARVLCECGFIIEQRCHTDAGVRKKTSYLMLR